MERPEESKILPTHSVALGSIFDSSGLCIGNFFTYAKFFGWCELGFRELQSEGKISVISDSQINSQIAFPFPVIPMS